MRCSSSGFLSRMKVSAGLWVCVWNEVENRLLQIQSAQTSFQNIIREGFNNKLRWQRRGARRKVDKRGARQANVATVHTTERWLPKSKMGCSLAI